MDRMGRRLPAAAVVIAAQALLLAACGGGSSSSTSSADKGGADSGAGSKVFISAGCGSCHTLNASGTTATTGPNLDWLKPRKEVVVQQVERGGGGMPSFSKTLTTGDIQAVAEYVSSTAGKGPLRKVVGFKPNKTTLADCTKDESPRCFEQAFGNLAYSQGPKVALDDLSRDMTTDRTVEADCHPIAHTIGAGALLHFKGNVGKAFGDGNPVCGSGYYHGLLQWKLAGVAATRVAAVARSVCSERSIEANAFTHYQCVHGLGHGLMLYTRYDLPEALQLCHQLDTGFNQTSCTGGVFMENQQSSYGIRSKWLSNTNLLYPCTIVARRDKLYCYLLVTSQILPKVGYNWDKTAAWCRRSDKGFVDICFQSYGRDASGNAREDPAKIRQFCGHAGSGEKQCLFGAVRDILNNEPNDIRARTLCDTVQVAFRSFCSFGIGSMVGVEQPTAAAKRQACRRFTTENYLAECLQGAGV
jgi:mono/diheme cytochrome c family protein